jgi:hypothetical protein
MYLFSPHADLHIKAANLAINHTEYYFNQIRNKIGDREFSNFLRLEICDENKHRKSASLRLISSSHLINLFILCFCLNFY